MQDRNGPSDLPTVQNSAEESQEMVSIDSTTVKSCAKLFMIDWALRLAHCAEFAEET